MTSHEQAIDLRQDQPPQLNQDFSSWLRSQVSYRENGQADNTGEKADYYYVIATVKLLSNCLQPGIAVPVPKNMKHAERIELTENRNNVAWVMSFFISASTTFRLNHMRAWLATAASSYNQ
jgi:hypothetical protein